MNLTNENYTLVAARVYKKALCVSTKAFLFDINYLDMNSDITRYRNNPSSRSIRLLINKIITAHNLFGPDTVDLMLFRIKEDKKDFISQLLTALNLYDGVYKHSLELEKEINDAFKRTTK